MTLRVAIDFGTSSTCVAVAVDGREPEVVVVDGQPLVPSAIYLAPDGTLFVGHEAERQAAVDPSRFEPHPKRRIDEGELLLGTSVLPVADAIRAVLTRSVGEARRVAGGAPVDQLVLTHPADWGAIRTQVLHRAAQGLAAEVVLVPEPVAAAVFHSAGHTVPDGAAVAVLDLGGGTVDASVVRRQGASFEVLATRGDPTFGGADIDQILLDHVGGLVMDIDPEAWRKLIEGRELSDRRRRRVLRQDVRGAKETLSRHAYTDVPMPPPFPDAHVTRDDLERLIAQPLSRAAELVSAAIRDARITPAQLAAVFLVGGSSRIPLVARLVHERTGVVPTTLDQPETVVARGALRAATRDPHRTGALPGPQPVTPVGGLPTATGPGFPQPPMSTPTAAGDGFPGAEPFPPGTGTPAGGLDGPTVVMSAPFPSPAGPTPPGGLPTPGALPGAEPVPASRRNRVPLLAGGAALLVVAVVALGVFLLNQNDSEGTGSGKESRSSGQQIAQYDYRFDVPEGWNQTGGDAAQRKVRIEPEGGPGSAAIVVQEFKLVYDSDQSRDRAVRELRTQVENAGFRDFQAETSFGGKDVVHYRQDNSDGTTVDWYVLFRGTTQVSVGCQYDRDGRSDVYEACDQVVRSLDVTG